MLLLFVVIFVMANASVPMFPKKKVVKKGAEATVVNDSLPVDSSISDSLPNDSLVIDELAIDTTKMDSLQLAIYHHNKAIDDSIMRDSMYRQRKNGLELPSNILLKIPSCIWLVPILPIYVRFFEREVPEYGSQERKGLHEP